MIETDDGSKATTKSVLPVPATAVNVPQGPLDLALRRRPVPYRVFRLGLATPSLCLVGMYFRVSTAQPLRSGYARFSLNPQALAQKVRELVYEGAGA